MYWYKQNWIIKFIFNERKSLPFYKEEELDFFEKDKIKIMRNLKNDWDYFCLFWLLLYKSNWVIAWYELSNLEYESLNMNWELIIDNKGWFNISSDEIREMNISNKTKNIKEKYNQIILDKYSYHNQINMAADIQEIHLVARLEKRQFNDDEMLKVEEATNMKNWIQEKRKECNREIENLKINT